MGRPVEGDLSAPAICGSRLQGQSQALPSSDALPHILGRRRRAPPKWAYRHSPLLPTTRAWTPRRPHPHHGLCAQTRCLLNGIHRGAQPQPCLIDEVTRPRRRHQPLFCLSLSRPRPRLPSARVKRAMCRRPLTVDGGEPKRRCWGRRRRRPFPREGCSRTSRDARLKANQFE